MSFGIPVRNGLMLGVSTYVALSARRVFSPASLFAAGEPGAWYDPSDFSTLFQDSVGTTPVTAVAQSVGLMLDKSKGGRQALPITGWVKNSGDGVVTVSGGTITITGATTTTRVDIAAPGWAVGDYGDITINGTVGSAVSPSVFVGGGAPYVIVSGPKTYQNLITSSTLLRVQINSGSATFDVTSRGYVPGNHAFQPNSGQRPTLGRNPTTGRLNLLTFTEEFNNAAWIAFSATATANAAVAPDGTTTADKIVEVAGGAGQSRYATATAPFATITASCYAKISERTFFRISVSGGGSAQWFGATFDVQNGTVTQQNAGASGTVSGATITAVGNGWYRCTVTGVTGAVSGSTFTYIGPSDTGTPTAGSFGVVSYTGTAGNGIFGWGAQLQTGTTATAYQRVVSSFDVTQAGVADLYYVNFDGTDDWMLSSTITPGIDKAQIFAGARKLSDAATGMLVESSVAVNSNAGAFFVTAPDISGGVQYTTLSRGNAGINANQTASTNLGPAPDTAVLAATHDIAGDLSTIRRNGVLGTNGTGDKGTGNFLAYPLYLGRRGGASNPFNGNVYSMIVRFGANLTADQIAATETWVNGKTGAY